MKRIFSLLRIVSSTRFLVRRLQANFIITHTAKKKFSTVVDIGCGRAPHKRFVTAERYIGVDIEDRGGVTDVVIADVNEGIPLPDNTADLVICTETLEHTKQPHLVVKEMYRITKVGGTVLLTTPMVWPVHEAPYDFFRYTNYGLAHLFQEAGFTEVKTRASNGYLYSMCALAQLHMRHWALTPIVVFFNVAGLLCYKHERNTAFPLGQHVVAKK